MELSVGFQLHNRYRIDSLLGKGGMGSLYCAWDVHLDIPVAVKENLDTSPEAQRQFAREAHILARLSHPNLPRVMDHFFIEGQGQYLVMDYIAGEDLKSMVERLGPLDESQVLTWISQMAAALTYLHNQASPIIHRDVKPANIKIRPDGRAMLVDFGIAKIYDPELITTGGAQLVTPGYSPPEQYGFGSTDVRSDIYALGATMYHLLTGEKPPESVQRMAGYLKLSPPSKINPNISPNVDQAICKAMEVDIEERFQSMHDLHEALIRRPISKSEQVVTAPAYLTASSAVTATPKIPSSAPPSGEDLSPIQKEAFPPAGRFHPNIAKRRLSRWWYLVGFGIVIGVILILSLPGLIRGVFGGVTKGTSTPSATTTFTTTSTYTPFAPITETFTPLPTSTPTATATAGYIPSKTPRPSATEMVAFTPTTQILPSPTSTVKRAPTSTKKPQPTSTSRPQPTFTSRPPPTKTLAPPPSKTPPNTLAPPPPKPG